MENPTLTIRIPSDLKAAVATAAARDDRSVTSFIVSALRLVLALETNADLESVRAATRDAVAKDRAQSRKGKAAAR